MLICGKMLVYLYCRDTVMSTKLIEQTTGLSSNTQLSANDGQVFIEARLDLALLAFSQRFNQLFAAPVAASHLIFGILILCLVGLFAYQFGSGG